MTRDEAVTYVRSKLAQDASTQTTVAQLQLFLQQKYYQLRRLLAEVAPSLYLTTTATQVLSSSDPAFDSPADMIRPFRLERQDGSTWLPVEPGDGLNTDLGDRAWLEQGATLVVSPASSAAGTYRLVYCPEPSVTGDYLVQVPKGLEDIVTHWVAAEARNRQDEQYDFHMAAADAIWRAHKGPLMKRYGQHPVSGLKRVRNW